MNENIKSKINRNLLYKQYIQNVRFESDFTLLKTFITELNELISFTKNLYSENLEKKLNNPLLQTKTFLKPFMTRKKSCNSTSLIKNQFCN